MGIDKGFCKIDQVEFIPLIAKCLSSFSKEVVLASSLEAYEVFDLKRIEDIYPRKGPIAKIQAALEYTSTDNNIIMSCDIPFISPTLIYKILQRSVVKFVP